MTLEKVKELMQTRMDYFEQHLSDETITAQLKAYTANLGTVPDDIAEAESITSEKCLLYVAMTRAQKGVYITSYGRSSEFLE